MGLDLIVARTTDRPIASVCLEGATYEVIMPLVLARHPRVFLRLTNYYEDAEIPVDELSGFGSEAALLAELPDVPEEVRAIARRIQSLATTAIREGLPIRAYAD